ncbi:MAG: hypothetical protein ACXW19_00430 [Thermoanaerobaculia bacterium]
MSARSAEIIMLAAATRIAPAVAFCVAFSHSAVNGRPSSASSPLPAPNSSRAQLSHCFAASS